MRFSLIDNSRINVYLSKEEIKTRNINLEEIYLSKCNIREKLLNIFDEANKETGFDFDGARLKIELIPIVDGDLLISIKKYRDGRNSVKRIKLFYEFSDIEDVFACISGMKESFSGYTSLYRYEDFYVLFIYVSRTERKSFEKMKHRLSEFGESVDISKGVLEEYGKKIMDKNAIKVIKKHFG